MRFACPPTPASLEDFDYDAAPTLDRRTNHRTRHLPLPGNGDEHPAHRTAGVGKTHLSVGLAHAAVHAGYRTYFTTAADLAELQ
ncbi:ATP-binding protein [Rhodococcus sp. NPDC059968]|uniref:ATP-binding protein n=1 Tax=Rhodococcus sp. NPDC059968 TaxID=3347017 RepID=UPI00366F8911